MIPLSDIRSLTDFHRNCKEHLRRLHRAGRPETLTINASAVLVVQDAAANERTLVRGTVTFPFGAPTPSDSEPYSRSTSRLHAVSKGKSS